MNYQQSDSKLRTASNTFKFITSASGLVVKFNVAIVEPLVRFRACAVIRDSLVARISACHAGDPGSIPGLGDFFEYTVFFACWISYSFCLYRGQHERKLLVYTCILHGKYISCPMLM